MLWLLPLAGMALGAMSNKENRWKGALTGAALGATGGMAAGAMGAGAAGGGLLGGAGAAGAGAAGATAAGTAGATGGGLLSGAAAPATTGMANGAFLGEGVASGVGAWDSAAAGSGLLGQLKTAGAAVKPFADAGGAAMQVKGLFGQEQPIQHAQMQQPMPGANQILAQLAQQGMQEQQMTAQAGAERRKRRQGLLGASYG